MKGEVRKPHKKVLLEDALNWTPRRKTQLFHNRIDHFVETAELLSKVTMPEEFIVHIKFKGYEINIEGKGLKGLGSSKLFIDMLKSYQAISEETQDEETDNEPESDQQNSQTNETNESQESLPSSEIPSADPEAAESGKKKPSKQVPGTFKFGWKQKKSNNSGPKTSKTGKRRAAAK